MIRLKIEALLHDLERVSDEQLVEKRLEIRLRLMALLDEVEAHLEHAGENKGQLVELLGSLYHAAMATGAIAKAAEVVMDVAQLL